jgi:outer membrane immunogenic protein
VSHARRRIGAGRKHGGVKRRMNGDVMMRFRLIATGVAALTLLAGSLATEAADMPSYRGMPEPVAYYTWNGFYAGINGGYAWGNSDWTVPAFNLRPAGWMVGFTAGYNLQVGGGFVLGLEGDYDWTDVGTSGGCAIITTCEVRNSYLATFRGRIGYAMDRFLPYITGGGAYGDIKAINSVTPFALSAGTNNLGWTIGGGIEYAFLGNFSAKLEYLYVDLGSFDPGFQTPAVANVNFTESIFRAGINYKFSGPLFSRY